jgi:dihydrofolate synthase/folylpolyglutamate synthase
MDYAAAIDFLFNLEHGSVKLGLERIAAATEELGHPERRYHTVHVAGTNGKGSTAAFLASILEAAGHRSGLLTSPHLLEYGERMRISGRMLAPHEIAALTTELKPLILRTRLSYFEATTALAFEAFARGGVSVAVMEVGMGGRLDATNVIQPDLTVITGIDLDHTKSLGPTRAAIAAEKAGIMKPGVPLLTAPSSAPVRAVFQRRGDALGCRVHLLDELASLSACAPRGGGTGYCITRRGQDRPVQRRIRLCGVHQAWNAVLAEVGAGLLAERGIEIGEEAIARGLAGARWPGRFEIIPGNGRRPPVILDVAHNASGGRSVAATYRRWMDGAPAPTLIVGMLDDKDHRAFFRSLRCITDRLLLIPLESPRAAPAGDLAAAARASGFVPETFGSMSAAWHAALANGTPIVIAGSFFTVKAGLEQLGRGPEAELFPASATPLAGSPAC